MKYGPQEFLTNSTSASNPVSSEEMLKNMQEAIDFLEKHSPPKIVYYQVSNLIEKGQIIKIPDSKLGPGYIVISREDFEENKESILRYGFLKSVNSAEFLNISEKLVTECKYEIEKLKQLTIDCRNWTEWKSSVIKIFENHGIQLGEI
jgi:hypothetical protein